GCAYCGWWGRPVERAACPDKEQARMALLTPTPKPPGTRRRHLRSRRSARRHSSTRPRTNDRVCEISEPCGGRREILHREKTWRRIDHDRDAIHELRRGCQDRVHSGLEG